MTREPGCCGAGLTGLCAAGLGVDGIFSSILSTFEAGLTLVGTGAEGPDGIFFSISSAFEAGLTLAGTDAEDPDVVSIFFTTSLALLIFDRPLFFEAVF